MLTAVVDYRGHRVVAQSIIPGILTNDKVSQVVYPYRFKKENEHIKREEEQDVDLFDFVLVWIH